MVDEEASSLMLVLMALKMRWSLCDVMYNSARCMYGYDSMDMTRRAEWVEEGEERRVKKLQ